MINVNEKFSYSKLSTYEQCGYRYKLTYVNKHFINQPSIATDVGTLIHATEETIANEIKNNLFGVCIDYKSLIADLKSKYDEIQCKYPKAIREKDKSDRTYNEKIKAYIESGIYRLENLFESNKNLEVIAAEQEFNLEYNNFHFHGFIDRIFYDNARKKYIIEDIKTYAVPITEDNLKTPLQFVIYALALSEMYKISLDDIECRYDLPFCDLKQDAGTAGFIKRGLKKIDNILKGISEDNFEPQPCPLCHWCPFSKTYIEGQPEEAKGLCPYFSHWTRDKKDFSVEYEWMGPDNDNSIVEAFRLDLEEEQNKNTNKQIKPKIEVISSERRFIVRR